MTAWRHVAGSEVTFSSRSATGLALMTDREKLEAARRYRRAMVALRTPGCGGPSGRWF